MNLTCLTPSPDATTFKTLITIPGLNLRKYKRFLNQLPTLEKGHIFKPSERFHTNHNPKGHLELLSRQMSLQMILSHRQLCNLKSLLPRTPPSPATQNTKPTAFSSLLTLALWASKHHRIKETFSRNVSLDSFVHVIPRCPPPLLIVSLTKEINCFSNSLFSKVLVITQKKKVLFES